MQLVRLPHVSRGGRPPRRRQHGITLLESLIALIVAALGVLGIVGVQMRTLTDTTTTVRRAQAIRLIEDLSERMRVNPNALMHIGDFVGSFSDMPALADTPPVNCTTSSCGPDDQAQYDLFLWQQTVQQNLPLGRASVFYAPGEPTAGNQRQLGVLIAWRENERSDLSDDDKKLIDATQNAGVGDDTDVNACPDGFTCHLQYVPLPARCAPYTNGGSFLYYCS